jgi:signal transduction histidine kinase
MQTRRIDDVRVPKGLAQSMATGIAALAVFLAVSFGCPAGFAAEPSTGDVQPKRVLMLHSFGLRFKPWTDFAEILRSEMSRRSNVPIDFLDHMLLTARLDDDKSDLPFVDYLRALYAEKPPDLIVAIGAPAANFVQRYRPRIFPKTPMLFTAVEARRVQYDKLTENDTVAAAAHDFPLAIETILQVLPDTKVIAVVNGASPNEVFWQGELERELAPFSGRVELRWYNRLSFEDILKDAANLPPHSAIFWHLMSVDAAGVAHEASSALSRLSSVANAPIFSYLDAFFGGEIVGGSMHSIKEGMAVAAEAAIRILNGEKAGDIKVAPTRFTLLRLDWRQMQRWGISEKNLPPGSQILFRTPTAWEEYRAYILAFVAAFLIQSELISWLLYEHRRRQRAEILARNTMSELTHVNRMATVSQLSASIAHEVRQPIAGIVANAQAALRWLAKPNVEEVRESLNGIVSEGFRASEVIANLRAMFKSDEVKKTLVDINKLVLSVLALVRTDLQKQEVELQAQLDDQIPQVLGNQVQLQQVVLNLVMNAIEAMSSSQTRMLRIKTELSQSNKVHVSIEDTGTGIKPSDVDRLFKPMFTTKARGMGMGLSICQSIIENHDSRIWVSPGANGGSIFHFELPTVASKVKQPELV